MTLHLPIHENRADIIQTIRAHQVTVVVGETGSGKTTQLPLLCREARRGDTKRIACTQPRRVAAVSIARYVAALIGEEPGGSIGYRVRFADKVSAATRLVFMTDGVLLNDIARDPLLRDYDTIILDEAHERTVTIDFLLGYFRTLLPRRPDLKLIIASATLDTGLFSRMFHRAPVVNVQGRGYPVEIRYQPLLELWNGEAMGSYLDGVITVVRELVAREPEGDMLIFLPTIQDIHDSLSPLRHLAARADDRVLPLHSRLRVEEQQQVFSRGRGRTIVVATNIAETSITVPNIRFVIDTGLARTLRYEPALGVSRMPVEAIARAAADQRAGRCGRVRDGICIRLYSEHDYHCRPRFTTPEIKRANLAGVILRMAWLRIGRPEQFPFPQRPPPRALAAARQQLRELGAIDRRGVPTPLGRKMARLPLDPPVARMLLYARREKAVREVAIIAAGLSVGDPRVSETETGRAQEHSVRFSGGNSDFQALVTIWDAVHRESRRSRRHLAQFCERANLSPARVREWTSVYHQIERILHRIGGFRLHRVAASHEAIHKSLLSGLAANIAHHEGNGLYRGVREHDIAIFPGSRLHGKRPRWILFHEVVETKRLYGRTAAAIHPRWVEELFPERCTVTWHDCHYDETRGTVSAREEVRFDGFTLVRNRWIELAHKDRERAHEVFVHEALAGERAGESWRFVAHNRALRERLELAECKLRTRTLYAGESALEQFYRERLPGVCSQEEMSRVIQAQGGDGFLCAHESDLLVAPIPSTLEHFPDAVVVADRRPRCEWRYTPGQPDDGVSIVVPQELFGDVPVEVWAWVLPALTRRRVEYLLSRGAPQVDQPDKNTEARVEEILAALTPGATPFREAMTEALAAGTAGGIDSERLRLGDSPAHLWPRIVVVGERGVVRAVFRAGIEVPAVSTPATGVRAGRWARWCEAYEQSAAEQWVFDNIPATIDVQVPGQLVALRMYPALRCEHGGVAVRLFWTPTAAAQAQAAGVEKLLETALAEELAWSMSSLTVPETLVRQCRDFTTPDELEQTVGRLTVARVLRLPAEVPRTAAAFRALVASAAEKIPLAATQTLDLLTGVAEGYARCIIKLEKMVGRYPTSTLYGSIAESLYDSLEEYMGMPFDPSVSPVLLDGLPRYLAAFEGRVETAFLDPRRYRTVMADISAFRDTLEKLRARPDANVPSRREQLEGYACWIEELAVAQFGRSRVRPLRAVTVEGLADRGRQLLGSGVWSHAEGV